jgi:hypothetical protein
MGVSSGKHQQLVHLTYLVRKYHRLKSKVGLGIKLVNKLLREVTRRELSCLAGI